MNKVTLLSVAFLMFAIGVSVWLLTRPSSPEASLDATPGPDLHAGLTFAEWSVHNDKVLLADIDPGVSGSTMPRTFVVAQVTPSGDGTLSLTDDRSFSWAAAERAKSSDALTTLGFHVSAEGRAFVPPDDPLWSDPLARQEGGAPPGDQVVTLRAKSGSATTSFTRHRSDPRALPYWNRRAIGFASSDNHYVYITPDTLVVPLAPR